MVYQRKKFRKARKLTEEQKASGKFGTFSMFHHQFLKRPGTPDTQNNSRLFYPVSTEDDSKGINQLLCEIFQFNNIKTNLLHVSPRSQFSSNLVPSLHIVFYTPFIY